MSKTFSLLLLLFFFLTDSYCRTIRIDNICSTRGIRKVFLGLGESGVLIAQNITRGDSNISFHEDCQLEIITCPACIISLAFRLMNLSCCCGSELNLFSHNPCRCDYVWITEPPYDDASGVSFCRVGPVSNLHEKALRYKSRTRTVRVSLFYGKAHVHAFTVDYKSQPNRQFFFGTSQELNLNTGSISSPFFPAAYPRDLITEYVLTCLRHTNFSFPKTDSLPEGDNNCRVHLVFTDFQLAFSSVMEFYDGSRRVGVVSGASFRPPAIFSSTNALTIRFFASGQNNLGFKGVFKFVSEKGMNKVARPSTECGGYVDSYGGTIAMMKMVQSEMKLFDCIWLIKPPKNFFSVKSHVYLKITAFLNFAGEAELEVRQGLTSESPILEKLRYPVPQNFQEHIISFKSGYYISLRALFGPESRFAVTYASFSHDECFVLSEFLCDNFRCISKKLTCDGFDHCGDNSDEPPVCYKEWGLESGVESRDSNTPSYYFPKIKEYSNLKTASIAFLVSLTGLVFFILSFTIVFYRAGSKAPSQRELIQNQIRAINDFQDYLSDDVSVEDIVIDDPPSYEPPPNYEDVVEMALNKSPDCDGFQPNSDCQRYKKSCGFIHSFTDVNECIRGSHLSPVPLIKGRKSLSTPSLHASFPSFEVSPNPSFKGVSFAHNYGFDHPTSG